MGLFKLFKPIDRVGTSMPFTPPNPYSQSLIPPEQALRLVPRTSP